MVPLLKNTLWFPEASSALRGGSLDGLVAVGGDLSVDRLLLAYRSGIFPWSEEPLTWWSPDPRAVLPFENLHISASLARELRRARFRITSDQAFERVIGGCAAPAAGREETWISPQFIRAYLALHKAGHAHSLECWQGTELVGGIYGVSIGAFFAGESMFHRAANASKIALVKLAALLKARGYTLFDVQMTTPITRQMGATEMPRQEYLQRLASAVSQVDCWCGSSNSAILADQDEEVSERAGHK